MCDDNNGKDYRQFNSFLRQLAGQECPHCKNTMLWNIAAEEKSLIFFRSHADFQNGCPLGGKTMRAVLPLEEVVTWNKSDIKK